ncbi:hypothetical protein DFH09DRAFT_1129010 [Mycena vulgaris]|nr:hypothetical protein DFH09DRAFT_1129010 [Mycena vulgaris]
MKIFTVLLSSSVSAANSKADTLRLGMILRWVQINAVSTTLRHVRTPLLIPLLSPNDLRSTYCPPRRTFASSESRYRLNGYNTSCFDGGSGIRLGGGGNQVAGPIWRSFASPINSCAERAPRSEMDVWCRNPLARRSTSRTNQTLF